jgi:MtN3 and saliva related transmembrane protein
MELKLLIGVTAGILTAVAAIPQVIKVIKTKKAESISNFMFVVLLCGNGLWCYYGILLKDLPIIITNGFSALMDILMILLKLLYGSLKSKSD